VDTDRKMEEGKKNEERAGEGKRKEMESGRE